MVKSLDPYLYIAVYLGLKINGKDILWIKKDATIEIVFKNGTYVVNEPVSEDIFFTFEIVTLNNQ